ncbi:MAG: endonuclease/exonuclease/phosphatase family protein, partial [Candidatus Krumholzibacteriota bacterium]
MTETMQTWGRRFILLAWGTLLLVLSGCAPETTLKKADFHFYNRLAAEPVVGEPSAEPDSLLCVTYNIEFAEKLEQALADLRGDPRLRHPDILLLQEMDPAGVAFLADSLGMNYCYYPSYIHPHHGRFFGTAVLSPWTLSEPKYIRLPYPNPLSDNRRTAVAVDVQIGKRVVRAVSVHMSTLVIDFEDRLDQMTIVRDSLASDTAPTIIGGDFNTGTHREGVLFRRVVRKAGFKEARLK